MTWVRFDDHYSLNEKVIDAGPLAELVDRRGIETCGRLSSDGILSTAQARRLCLDIIDQLGGLGATVTVDDLIGPLVTVGRWIPTDDGWQIHDFLDYNPSRADLDKRAADKARAGAAGGRAAAARRRSKATGPASAIAPATPAAVAGATDAATAGARAQSKPDPDPDPDPVFRSPTRSSSSPTDRDDDDDLPTAGKARLTLVDPTIRADWTPTSWTRACLDAAAAQPDPIDAATTVIAEHLAEHADAPVGAPGRKALRAMLLEDRPADVLEALHDAIVRSADHPIAYARKTLASRRTA